MNYYTEEDLESGNARKIFEQVRNGEAVIVGRDMPDSKKITDFANAVAEKLGMKRLDRSIT